MTNVNEKIKGKTVVATSKESNDQLGHIFWYSITSNIEVTRVELENEFQSLGIDENWLPNPIRPSDAFRRATKEVQVKKVPTSNPNVFQNFLVREVYSDQKMIQRNIVIETVDQSGKRLDYQPKATEMTFLKEDNKISIWSDNENANNLAKQAKDRFQKYVDFYSAQQLRVMINKIISSLAPTPIRSNGGVYFIPQNYANELKKLQLLCNFLQSEGVSVPLQDTSDNKNLVLSKLEYEMKEVLDRCRDLSNNDNMQKSLYKDSVEEARRIANTYKSYKDNLALDVDNLEDLLNDLRVEAIKITNKITA